MPLLLNTLVMLDEFTPDNGATYLLTGSQKSGDKPTDEDFFSRADRALGPAGSIVIFNSNMWHAGGANMTA
jgi:ectoine hydroxylase-related dioxygenase (phytanoyl-CoA dioxygenase family)